MNCPYCNRRIEAFTGFQEATKFSRHLNKCRKRPANLVEVHPGLVVRASFTLKDALEIRAKSGQ